MQSLANAATAANTVQSQPSSPVSTKTCNEPSAADRGLFWASKYANYCRFIAEIATYLPEVQPWASSLRLVPLCAFQLHTETVFKEAIAAHRRGDHQGRDHAASAVVRAKAAENGLDVTKLRAEHYSRLIRYSSLFTILAVEDSLM